MSVDAVAVFMSNFPRAAELLNGFAVAAGTAAKRLRARAVPTYRDDMFAQTDLERSLGLCA